MPWVLTTPQKMSLVGAAAKSALEQEALPEGKGAETAEDILEGVG